MLLDVCGVHEAYSRLAHAMHERHDKGVTTTKGHTLWPPCRAAACQAHEVCYYHKGAHTWACLQGRCMPSA